MSRYVPGSGPVPAKLMIIGDYPGSEELRTLQAFTGMDGTEARNLILEAGGAWSAAYVTNVYKYQPPVKYKRGVKVHEWPHWSEGYVQLWNEIEAVNPNCILSFGALSFETLTGRQGLLDFRGSILRTAKQINGRFIKVVSTIHPINYLKQQTEGGQPYQARAYVQSDVEKAVRESRDPDFNLPHRTLKVIRNSADLRTFDESYKNKLECASDIETSKTCLPVCTAFAFSPWHAVSVPLVPHLLKLEPMEMGRIYAAVDEIYRRPGIKLIGQNWKFDDEKLEMVGFQMPAPWLDTSFLHHSLYPEFAKSLAFMCSVWTDEPYYKDEGKGYDPNKDDPSRLLLYNAKDAAVTFELAMTLLKEMRRIDGEEGHGLETFFFDYVMKLHTLYKDMELHGLHINEQLRAHFWLKYKLMLYDRAVEFKQRFGYVLNPNSNNKGGQVWDFLFNRLRLPQRTNVDDDTLSALYGNNAKTDEQKFGINYVLDCRKIRKFIAAYIEAELDYDRRLRTIYNVCGTETGRSSTSVLKSPIRIKQVGVSLHQTPKHGIFGEYNEMIEADPGWVIGNTDLSQAEPRCVANLSRDYELLKRFDYEDVHWATAGIVLQFDHSFIKCPSKDDPRRFCGKTVRNGGNYNMKKHALAEHTNGLIKRFDIQMDMISEYKANEMLERFHRVSPRIRGVFHAEIVEALERFKRVLYTPHGRRRQFGARWGDDLFKEAFAYIPQATIIDHLRQAALRARARDKSIVFIGERHDALIWTSPIEAFVEHAGIIKEELNKPIDFSQCSLPRDPLLIPADIEYGFNMKAMKKFKGEVER